MKAAVTLTTLAEAQIGKPIPDELLLDAIKNTPSNAIDQTFKTLWITHPERFLDDIENHKILLTKRVYEKNHSPLPSYEYSYWKARFLNAIRLHQDDLVFVFLRVKEINIHVFADFHYL